MDYKIVKSKGQDKARRSFMYQCRLASNCRHERCQISCDGCPSKDGCGIQNAIESARARM